MKRSTKPLACGDYDADGNRVLTIYKSGATETSRVYTPFPEFEESVPPSGATTQRRSYYLAGQFIAVRVRTGTTGTGALYFAYADHLGSIAGYYDVTLAKFLDVSLARYEPFGGYRTKPLATVNPGVSDRGFTDHRHNNTGANDLGLIYMNARYYLPEIGRFISADSIVPERGTLFGGAAESAITERREVRNEPATGSLEATP
jgi:RHS repeat-associated protein